jgi:rhodanese-related sulfurtransferase
VMIDLRPQSDFAAAHIPFARSIPLEELKKRLAELPSDKNIVAYCRGPFCLFATEAVKILEQAGYKAKRLDDGVAEWQAHGFSIEK